MSHMNENPNELNGLLIEARECYEQYHTLMQSVIFTSNMVAAMPEDVECEADYNKAVLLMNRMRIDNQQLKALDIKYEPLRKLGNELAGYEVLPMLPPLTDDSEFTLD